MGESVPEREPCRIALRVVPTNSSSCFPSARERTGPNASGTLRTHTHTLKIWVCLYVHRCFLDPGQHCNDVCWIGSIATSITTVTQHSRTLWTWTKRNRPFFSSAFLLERCVYVCVFAWSCLSQGTVRACVYSMHKPTKKKIKPNRQ